jgi:probable DNA metabolism protein
MKVIQSEFFEERELLIRKDAAVIFSAYSNEDPHLLPDLAGLYELSVNAYYAALHAQMSELPIKREIFRFIDKVKKTNNRAAADRAAFDRGDPDVATVLKAASKVLTEIHRLTGLLRFRAEPSCLYTARCSPDYFILPALAEHFTLRFGETSWAIIDEKRELCLKREKGGLVRLIPVSASSFAPQLSKAENCSEDNWEKLWKLYHSSVNNEGRKNLRLQRQFIPERYHKYLPEIKS